MFSSTLFAALTLLGLVNAHGNIASYVIDGVTYPAYVFCNLPHAVD